jgi:sugar transferase (PEP-CTERM system associated)
VEGTLIFAVIYGMTLAAFPGFRGDPVPWVQILWLTIIFSIAVHATRRASFTGEPSLIQELLLLTLISVGTGAVAFLVPTVLRADPTGVIPTLPLYSAVAVPTCIALWRWFALRLEVLSYYRERVLIVGTGETAKKVGRWMTEAHSQQYAIVGFAAEEPSREGEVVVMGSRVVTSFREMGLFCPRRVDRVIVALDEKRGKLPIKALINARMLGLRVDEATTFFERCSGKISVEMLLPSWLIFQEGFHSSLWRSVTKRCLDLVASIILLILTLPLSLLTAILIKIESRGPVIYKQHRMGLEGREFDVLKFRSMGVDAEAGGPRWASEDDPRVTRIGRLIRKLRIDELPQLINVLRGDMSFVGPRPERRHFVDMLEDRVPYYMLRLTVRPGITGWAQVSYRYGSSDEDALEKLKFDLYYIKNGNLTLDLWIIIKTIRVVLFGSGAR